ncbi:beta-lactamase/transpeptidase-like protein [Biscogniauxia mediterranea]|nr:beta-lactamase/transpeptidase-like protein [Biscogniauxia mediterranea]
MAFIESAVAVVKAVFQETTSAVNTTGTSLSVKSIHESSPLLDIHYTPPSLNTSGTTSIDAQTIYCVGSISKIFPLLALLTQKSVRPDDPITKYVPELLQLKGETDEVNDITTVQWELVTLGALASHMSGIGSDPWASRARGDESKTGCAGVLGLPSCSRTEFFRDFGKRHPVFAPFSPNAVYSNVASSILGFAVEAITNMTYDKFIHQSILAPLGMTNTSIFNPTSQQRLGIHSGREHMRRWLLLEHGRSPGPRLGHRLIDAVTTRKWMKPVASTSGSSSSTYTKPGNIDAYNGMLVLLVPEYDLAVSARLYPMDLAAAARRERTPAPFWGQVKLPHAWASMDRPPRLRVPIHGRVSYSTSASLDLRAFHVSLERES